MVEFELYNGVLKVSYELTEDKKDKIIEHLMKYIKNHDCIDGEHLMQDDECLTDAPNVLCDILDVFEFQSEWDG